MTRTVLRGAYALLGSGFDFERRPLDVLVDGERISAIEPANSIHDAGAVIDLTRHLLVPGFINGHMHSHEHFHRGRTENLPLELWQHYVRSPVPVVLTPRQIYLRTAIGALESLRTGATCVVDDLAVGGAINRVLVDAVLQAYEDVGVRALVGFAMMDRPLVDTFPFADTLPHDLCERLRALPRPTATEYLGLVNEVAATRHPKTRRVGVLVAPSAPRRGSQEFLVACAGLADELDLPIITHVQETRLQVVTGLEFYGSPIVEYLARIKFLGPRTTLIHAVWLNPREIRALAETGATAQYNPWSNQTLGSGVQAVPAAQRSGPPAGVRRARRRARLRDGGRRGDAARRPFHARGRSAPARRDRDGGRRPRGPVRGGRRLGGAGARGDRDDLSPLARHERSPRHVSSSATLTTIRPGTPIDAR